MSDWPAFFRWLMENLVFIIVGALVLILAGFVAVGAYGFFTAFGM